MMSGCNYVLKYQIYIIIYVRPTSYYNTRFFSPHNISADWESSESTTPTQTIHHIYDDIAYSSIWFTPYVSWP